jgi:DNA-binding response OmpR family regulator
MKADEKVAIDLETRKQDISRPKTQTGPIRRALVIEDDPVVSALIEEVLASVGIEVVTPAKRTENELHFREKKEEKYDLVLIGLCKSPEDDVELIRKFRRSGPNQMTPIILISSDQRPSALSRGFEAGATFFVYKPIDRARLVNLIRATEGTVERERRRFRRVPIQIKVRLKSAKCEVVGETIDISLNGALVKSSQTLPVGSLMEVSLYLRNTSRPVVGLGSVVRLLDNSRMGILLNRFPMAEIGRLQEYLLPRISN